MVISTLYKGSKRLPDNGHIALPPSSSLSSSNSGTKAVPPVTTFLAWHLKIYTARMAYVIECVADWSVLRFLLSTVQFAMHYDASTME